MYLIYGQEAHMKKRTLVLTAAGLAFVRGPPIHEPKRGVKLGDTFG